MPIQSLENPVFISVDGAGRANAGGTVGVYVAGTSFGTLATIYSDQVKTTELTNPITLDDAGTKEIWFDVKVDIQEKTSAGVLIRDTLNLDPNATATVSTGFNLATNGSFETDSDSDGQPDSWTISPYSGSAIAITSSVVTDGVKALEFNTAGAGSGGGTATSAKFAVTEGAAVECKWGFYATHATTLNTFQIRWYNELDVLQSTSTVTMPASGSVPTSWTRYNARVAVDAAGTQGEIVLTGISSGGSNLSSKAYFDGIKVTEVVDLEPVIYDSVGNEVISTGKIASAVNNIKVTNAATGAAPTISTVGEADIGIDFENDQSEEMLLLRAIPSAVNEITISNAITATRPVIASSGEADIGIDFENSEGEELLELIATPTAINNVRITNSAAGNGVIIEAVGGDTDIDVKVTAKGTGGLETPTNLLDANQNEYLTHVATASAVNNVRVTNATTGLAALIDSTETDTNINIAGNGTGVVELGGTACLYTGKGYGGRVLIETQTISATPTEVDFSTGIDSTYRLYVLELINVVPTTNADTFSFIIQTGGATWQTGAVYTTKAAAGQASLPFATPIQNTTANGGVSGEIFIYNPAGTTHYTMMKSTVVFQDSGTNLPVNYESTGYYAATTAVTGFRIDASGVQTFASGEVRLYGIIV